MQPSTRPAALATLAALALAAASAPLPAQTAGVTQADGRVCGRAIESPVGDPARAALTEALGQAQGARAAYFRGCQLAAAERFDAAAKELEGALKEQEANAVVHFWVGRAYGAQAQKANVLKQAGLAKKTKQHFERAVALDADYLDARVGLVQYYLQAPGIMGGSVDKARAQAGEIAKRNPYRGAFVMADIAIDQKDPAGAARAIESLIAQYPDSTAPYVSVTVSAITRRDWPVAWSTVDRFERAHPALPLARYLVGRVAAESGDRLDRGEQALRRYLTDPRKPTDPTVAATHWRLGMILEKKGDRAAARAEYETAVALDPKLKGPKEALAKMK